jgi:glycosyltransferase involved in cell wall biosynthesis
MDELSIIIPTLNEQRYIPVLLESLAKQQFAGKLQVIVVDGQSTDMTERRVADFKDRLSDLLFLSTSPDIGHQRNMGVSKAKYRYLLFLDADVILPDHCLSRLSKKVDGKENFMAAILHLNQNMTIVDCFALAFVYGLFFISWLARMPVTNGDFILTTRAVHDRINGFREGAILGEDTDYGFRAVKAGTKYQFIFATHVIASDRRMKQMGRFRLILLWAKVFLRVKKHGPTYSGVDYPFGHYDQEQ